MTLKLSGLFSVVLFVSYLAGCSSGMSKEECQLANWQQVGFEDGSVGRSLNYIASRRKSCAKAGVTPDFEAYKKGHMEGLRQWCNYDSGYHYGNSGRRYQGICPKDLEPAFLEGYEYGQRLHLARSAVSTVQRDIDRAVSTIQQLEQERIDLGELIIAEETPTVERAKGVARIKDIGDEITDLELYISDREIDLRQAEVELQNVRP